MSYIASPRGRGYYPGMLKKLILPVAFASLFLGGCFVHTHGGGHGCGHGYRWNGNRCVATIHPKKNKGNHNGQKKDVVIIRDHRR
jgi:hypothetical protein